MKMETGAEEKMKMRTGTRRRTKNEKNTSADLSNIERREG